MADSGSNPPPSNGVALIGGSGSPSDSDELDVTAAAAATRCRPTLAYSPLSGIAEAEGGRHGGNEAVGGEEVAAVYGYGC